MASLDIAPDDKSHGKSLWRHGDILRSKNFDERLWRAWGFPDGDTTCEGYTSHSYILKFICEYPSWIALSALKALAYYFEKEGRSIPSDVNQIIEALIELMGHPMDKVHYDDGCCYKDDNKVIWIDTEADPPSFRAYSPGGYGDGDGKDAQQVFMRIMEYSVHHANDAIEYFRDYLANNYPEELEKAKDCYHKCKNMVYWTLWKRPKKKDFPENFKDIITNWAINH